MENDIQRTADGELVIVHDTTLARTTDVEQVFPDRAPWNIADFTLAEIKRLDAGSWFAPEFAGERVPTLEEWVDAVGRKTGMLLEAKEPGSTRASRWTSTSSCARCRSFTRALRAGRVVVQSFDHEWLRGYDDLAPDVPTGLLFAGGPTERARSPTQRRGLEQANPALGDMTEATVDQIHAFGLETHVWTVNGGQDMRRAISWDVDGIITNYPQVLVDILRRG